MTSLVVPGPWPVGSYLFLMGLCIKASLSSCPLSTFPGVHEPYSTMLLCMVITRIPPEESCRLDSKDFYDILQFHMQVL
jgi:hypothetical protein